NLGRAPLAEAAIAAMAEVARGYSNLEYDLARGERGSRHGHLAALLREVTGAEDAVVVNNNAAACVLALSALAAGRGGAGWCRAASWWRSAARSGSRTSCGCRAAGSSRWAPRTRRGARTTSRRSAPTPRCC